MPELATAWITLAVSADNMQRDIRRELQKIDDGTAKTVGRKIGKDLEAGVGVGADGAAGQVKARFSERLGSQVGSVVGKGIGAGIKLGIAGAAGAAALAVGGIGVALSKGFDRLKSIDQAKFKLQALGNDAGTTAKIMDNALASVKGTAFGLQDAATAAASAVAAGIQPGQDLTKYLSEVGDAAAVAGTNFEDMGSIFNKIQTSNKAYTDDLQQLSDRGLPIFTWLQKEYGVTGEALSKMVQDGEVDAAHFQHAIETNIGGAAQKMGQSFEGAVDNMEASVARLGANFITAILGGDPANALGGPTEAITNLTKKFDEIGIWVNDHSGEIHGFFEDVRDVAVRVGSAVKSIGDWLVENKGAAETLAAVFVGWKVATAVAGVVTSLKSMSTLLRTTLPEDAAVGATGISKALSLIVIPALGVELGQQIQAAVDSNPTLRDINHAYTPDQLGKQFRDWLDNQGTDSGTPKGPLPDSPSVVPGAPPPSPFDPNPLPFQQLPRRASGGSVFGAGTATSDSIPALLSNGEHVWTAAEVAAAGGQGNMYRLRGLARAGLLKLRQGGAALGLPLDTDDGRVRKGGGPGSRTRNRGPGNNPNEIGTPDWSTPGQGWGGAPDWWWDRPIDPDDVVFPDFWGQMPWGKHPLDKGAKRVQGLGFDSGGAVSQWNTRPDMSNVLFPRAGGLFPPNALLDTSRTSVSGPPLFWEPGKSDFLFGDIAKHGVGGGKIGKGIPFKTRRFDPQTGSAVTSIWGPGFAGGGGVGDLPSGPGDYVVQPNNVMSALDFAQSVSGNQYSYGSAGPTLFDCSGYMSAIYGIVTGKSAPAGQRFFTTESDFSNLGFLPGYDANSPFNIGVHNGGGGMNSHMAGTLAGINVESGGASGKTQFGGSAAGAMDAQFSKQYHLPGSLASMYDMSGQTAAGSYEVDQQAVFDAESRTIAARNDLEVQRKQLSELEAKGTASESQLLAARNDVAEQERDVQSSEAKLADAKRGKFKKSKDQGSISGSGGMDASSLGQSLFSGLLEGIGLDGSVFSNPFEWPNVKSLMAGLNFGGSLLKGVMGGGQDQSGGMDLSGGGGGIPGLDSLTGLLKPIGPQSINPIDPNTTQHGQGGGAAPGPTFNVTANGLDPKAVVDKQSHAFNQAWRGSGLPAVRP